MCSTNRVYTEYSVSTCRILPQSLGTRVKGNLSTQCRHCNYCTYAEAQVRPKKYQFSYLLTSNSCSLYTPNSVILPMYSGTQGIVPRRISAASPYLSSPPHSILKTHVQYSGQTLTPSQLLLHNSPSINRVLIAIKQTYYYHSSTLNTGEILVLARKQSVAPLPPIFCTGEVLTFYHLVQTTEVLVLLNPTYCLVYKFPRP